MRILLTLLLVSAAVWGQQPPARGPEGGANLPALKIGPNDLVYVWVYDAPEFTGYDRVGKDGDIRIPLLKKPISATDLTPSQLEVAVAHALVDQGMLVDPNVTVTVAEYQSHPITVSGSVKQPLVFQATQTMSLLEAIDRAGGLAPEAGNEILVTVNGKDDKGQPTSNVTAVPIRALIDRSNPALNLQLNGGEEISVPMAEKIYVAGNVKTPGAYAVQNSGDTTVIAMIAMAQGLAPFSSKNAFIYRLDKTGGRSEIPLPLDQIMNRKSPDVALEANDIVYVPDNKKGRITAQAIDRILSFGATAGTGLLIYAR